MGTSVNPNGKPSLGRYAGLKIHLNPVFRNGKSASSPDSDADVKVYQFPPSSMECLVIPSCSSSGAP